MEFLYILTGGALVLLGIVVGGALVSMGKKDNK